MDEEEREMVDEEEGEMEEEELDGHAEIDEIEEDDEELSKWNVEDDRKHLETQLEEKLEERNLGKSDSSADFLSAPLPEKTQQTVNEVSLPEESTQWSDSSSLIAPGQGNCISTTATGDVKSTPFTKLLKSGLLDSASKSSFGKGNSLDEVSSFLFGVAIFMQHLFIWFLSALGEALFARDKLRVFYLLVYQRMYLFQMLCVQVALLWVADPLLSINSQNWEVIELVIIHDCK